MLTFSGLKKDKRYGYKINREKKTAEGVYAMIITSIIIDTDKHGRVLLSEGFGGMGSINGGMYRWRHGIAISLKPDDTMEKLESMEWHDGMSYLNAIYYGLDDDRPILEWPGYLIEKVAIKAIREN